MKDVQSIHLAGTVNSGAGVPGRWSSGRRRTRPGQNSADLKFVVRSVQGMQTLVVHDNVSYDYRSSENTVQMARKENGPRSVDGA